MRSNTTDLNVNNALREGGFRILRLAGCSALLGFLAGAGAMAFAATPQGAALQTPTPATAQGDAPAAPATAIAAALPDDTVSAPALPPAAGVKGKKDKKKKKEKPPKLTPIHIEQGTLTVDGWTGKARLNYDIADLKYIYVWAPGIGTIVASNQKFPFGKEEPGAFNGNTLTLEAGGHIIQLSSEKKLLKEKKPSPAYVFLDTSYKASSAFPEMGYGNGKDAPYSWPGAKEAPVNKGSAAPPPLPAGMRAVLAGPTCKPTSVSATSATPSPAPAASACPAPATPPITSPSAPAAVPSVPLPGYSSGTSTARVGDPAVGGPLP